MLGMEGPNLAEKHRQQILMCAPKTPLIKIQKIDNLHFDVQSLNSTKLYHIGLDTTTCSCSDFPHIWLCKHITAVVHFFGGANLGPQPPSNTSSELQPPNSPIQQDGSTGSADDGTTASIVLMANDIIGLTQELVLKAPRDPGLAKSLNSIWSCLNALLLSAIEAGNGFHLPEKENIGPNQCSWPEMALQIGVKHSNKICGKGKVNSVLTAQHIGEPNCKHAGEYDPYGVMTHKLVLSLFIYDSLWLSMTCFRWLVLTRYDSFPDVAGLWLEMTPYESSWLLYQYDSHSPIYKQTTVDRTALGSFFLCNTGSPQHWSDL